MQVVVTACAKLQRFTVRYTGLNTRLYYLAAFLTLWDCGLRIGDIPAVRVDRFDPRGLLWVHEHKTGKSRWRPLTADTTAAIAALIAIEPGREFIWPGHTSKSLAKTVNRILKSLGLPGTSRYIRRGSSSDLDALHPGQGWRFLNHSGPMVFENHYRVAGICDIAGMAPPALELQDASRRIIAPVPPKRGRAKEPKPAPEIRPAPTLASVKLSTEATEALGRSPLGPSELKTLAECLASQGVTQTTLAKWWGYKLKFYQNMRYGYKAIPREAADRLRKMFGVARFAVTA